MKKRVLTLLPFTGFLASLCVLAFTACQLENRADINALDASFSEEFLETHEDLETEVRTVVQAAKDSATGSITWSTIRPANGQSGSGAPEACCWAHTAAGSLAPDDEGGVNTYSDTCAQTAAVDGSNTTWWNMNYMRSAASPTLNKKHANKNTNDGGNHWITLDLGGVYNISGIIYRGRNGNTNSRILAYKVFVSEIADLGRDPGDKNTGDHPGHRPPAEKLVHQGTFADNANEQTVTFSMPAYGQYVQLRVISSYNDNGNDGGAAELRVIRDTTPSAGSLTAALNTAIGDAMTQNGYHELAIDDSYLSATYQDGLRVLGPLKNNPVKFNKLNPLLHGSLDAEGNVTVKGASQYLNDDPDRPRETLATESDVNAYFAYQNEIDALTRQIRLLLSALQSPSNS